MAITGDRFDLDDARKLLRPPFEPWVEEFESDGRKWVLLRSSTWEALDDHGDVSRDAERIIERLNGALRVVQADSRGLTFDDLMRFDSDGRRETMIFVPAAKYELKLGRVRISVAGQPQHPSEPAKPSLIQEWFAAADQDDVQLELFSHLARMTDWFGLYKAAELVRLRADNGSSLKRILGADWKDWDLVWQTANCYRHAPNPKKFKPPDNPPTFQQACVIVLRAAETVLRSAE